MFTKILNYAFIKMFTGKTLWHWGVYFYIFVFVA